MSLSVPTVMRIMIMTHVFLMFQTVKKRKRCTNTNSTNKTRVCGWLANLNIGHRFYKMPSCIVKKGLLEKEL